MAAEWNRIAEAYEERVEPFTSQFVAPLLEVACKSPNSEKVLDVACGAGAVAMAAAERGARVVATDYSERLVARLQERAITGGLALEETVVADGHALPLRWAGQFDAAVSSFGAIFFESPERGIAEMVRCLKPGGRVAITAWGASDETEAFQQIPAAARECLDEAEARKWRPEARRIHGSAERLTALLESAGLEQVRIVGPVTRTCVVADARAYWLRFAEGSPGTREKLAALSADRAAALQAAVEARMRARFGDGEIALPASAYIAVGVASRLGPLRVGTAGFANVSGSWAGPFFAPGAKRARGDAALDFLQERFDCVEVPRRLRPPPPPAHA